MKYLIGTNIKMYRTWLEANLWLSAMNRDVPESSHVDVALFPPYFSLVGAKDLINKSNIGFGAQNMCWQERGPFTGEVSPLMLQELACRYVELGHHERRLYFNECDQVVNKKVILALQHGLMPIVCVGEDEEFKRNGSEKFLKEQMNLILQDVTLDDPSKLIIAYEPRWAIGKDQSASADHIAGNCYVIRQCLNDYFGETGEKIRIIYGGSVNLEDVETMLTLENVNGLFIGRTALDTEKFAFAVKIAEAQAQKDLSNK